MIYLTCSHIFWVNISVEFNILNIQYLIKSIWFCNPKLIFLRVRTIKKKCPLWSLKGSPDRAKHRWRITNCFSYFDANQLLNCDISVFKKSRLGYLSLMVLIERITNIIRPGTLAICVWANIIAINFTFSQFRKLSTSKHLMWWTLHKNYFWYIIFKFFMKLRMLPIPYQNSSMHKYVPNCIKSTKTQQIKQNKNSNI